MGSTATADLVKITVQPLADGAPLHPDFELVRLILARDRKATAEWVDRFSGPVNSYVRSRLMPRTDLVDDVVQDVFVAAWQYLPGYRGASPLGAWLMGIARHKVEDHYRRKLKQWDSWDEDGPEPPDGAAVPIDEELDRQRLSEKTQRILSGLPEHYAAALLWRYWERRPAREIAESTGRTEKAVERLLARARENFKRRWQDG
jgi:RNA polymerase sigma-70 factor, ECF subfamily